MVMSGLERRSGGGGGEGEMDNQGPLRGEDDI